MFESTSRYSSLPTSEMTTSDGRVVRYVRRRFLPQSENMPLLGEIVVTDRDGRLDHVTYRALGVAELFWWLCDANEVMNPLDLDIPNMTDQRLHVPVPQVRS